MATPAERTRNDAGAGDDGRSADLTGRVEALERRLDAVLLVLEGASGAISSAAAGARRP